MTSELIFPLLDGSVELTHWGLIRAEGDDAAAFLHGQLTHDFKLLDGSQTRLAAFCSPKGRMLASFLGWAPEPGFVSLACHQSVVSATLKRLSMFVLRARCKLTSPVFGAPDSPRLWGLAGDSAVAALDKAGNPPVWSHCRLSDGHSVIHLPPVGLIPRAWVIGHQAPSAPSLTLDAWRWTEVCSGIPCIEDATREQFVPQMINFELIGGVHFQKGCYPGQEVVARSQYRGTIKRRMFLFEVDAPARAAQEVFHPEDPGQPAGMVVNSAPSLQGSGCVMLVEVKRTALQGPALRLGEADGPALRPIPLPYDVPAEGSAFTEPTACA